MLRKNELRSVINETVLYWIEEIDIDIYQPEIELLVDKLETNIKSFWDKEDV